MKKEINEDLLRKIKLSDKKEKTKEQRKKEEEIFLNNMLKRMKENNYT